MEFFNEYPVSGLIKSSADVEKTFVHNVYNYMGECLQKGAPGSPRDVTLRSSVQKFLAGLEPATFLLDIGCGNGKYLTANPFVFSIGCDYSNAYMNSAQNSSLTTQLSLADNLSLPYRSNAFDHALSVAVIHHFASERRRVSALSEIFRVLRPNGTAFLCVWAHEQANRKFASQDVLIPMAAQKEKMSNKYRHSESENETTVQFKVSGNKNERGDNSLDFDTKLSHFISTLGVRNLVFPFILEQLSPKSLFSFFDSKSTTFDEKLKSSNQLPTILPRLAGNIDQKCDSRKKLSKTISVKRMDDHCGKYPQRTGNCLNMRFYHVFRAGELDDLIKDNFCDVKILQSFYERGNWCLIVKKQTSNLGSSNKQ